MNIIGRTQEKRALKTYMESPKPEFLVVYGRRRVGKTYLIKEFFENGFCFYCTGVTSKDEESEEDRKAVQLKAFNDALNRYGEKAYALKNNWFDTFVQLRVLVEASGRSGKKILFIDEIPWLDTPKSGFLTALEYFWNSFASSRPDILLIACGSATSWIAEKLVQNTGGLFNRVTKQMRIDPFTLKECAEFLSDRGIVLNRHQIVETYMIFGGVPFYLDLFEPRYGLPQNVDLLCFGHGALLGKEYVRLYATLFRSYESHHRVTRALAAKAQGLTREELLTQTGLGNGGGFTRTLDELEQCGFVKRYLPFLNKRKEAVYQLSDPFTLFYHKFMSGRETSAEDYWSNGFASGSHAAWSGYAFEQVCLAHIPQIKRALGISGISANISSWRGTADGHGAQIDLVIDRRDQIVNLCEMKYAVREFEITKAYREALERKAFAFASGTKTNSALHTTLVTTYGVKPGKHRACIQSEVTMQDLFA